MDLFDADLCLPPQGPVRGPDGLVIAEVVHEEGRAVLLDRLGNRLAVYDPRLDLTFDAVGKVLARGNGLRALLGIR